MLMSLDTSTTSRSVWRSFRPRTTPRIWLSALPTGRLAGSVTSAACVWKYSRPAASLLPSASSGMPSSMGVLHEATSASSVRDTCRALRATSLMPFLCASSSSSVIIGRKMSCSSKRNGLVGSCSSTFVSSTNSFGDSAARSLRPPPFGLDSTTARCAAGAGRDTGVSGPRASGSCGMRSMFAGAVGTGTRMVAGLVGAFGSGISGGMSPSEVDRVQASVCT